MADLKAAMRDGDVTRREAIRMLRAAILNEEIEKRRPLDEGELGQVLRRVISRHEDSIEQFQKGGRRDLVDHEQGQLAVVRGYLAALPQPMSRDEVAERARVVIAELGASGPRDTGKVMGRLAGELRGKADMRQVNQVVQELLGA